MIIDNIEASKKIKKLLRKEPEFKPLRKEAFNALADSMVIKTYREKQILFDQGDYRQNYFYLIDGAVEAFWDYKNKNLPEYLFIGPHKAFPYVGLFEDQKYIYGAQAMTDVTLAILPMNMYENAIKQSQVMMIGAIHNMNTVIKDIRYRFTQVSAHFARYRVENVIDLLVRELGVAQKDNTTMVPYSITLNKMAKISNLTRETTGKIVRKLIENGKLEYKHKKIRVPNLP